jgi:hypothetical protein
MIKTPTQKDKAHGKHTVDWLRFVELLVRIIGIGVGVWQILGKR